MKTLYYFNELCERAGTLLIFRYVCGKGLLRVKALVGKSPISYAPIKIQAWVSKAKHKQLLFVKGRWLK